MTRSKNTAFWQGVAAMLPLAIACIPWGILTGALAIQVGFTPIQAQVMSLLVFAGAAQLSGLTMHAAGAGFIPILGSTFVISSRHLLYSLTFRKHVDGMSAPMRWTMAFVLTDEMFAVSEADTRRYGVFCPTYALSSGFTFWFLWGVSTAIGIFAGEHINNLDDLGLDFAIAATFIAMTFTELRRFPVFATMLASGAASVLLKPFLPDSHILLASLLGMAIGYWLHKADASQSEAASQGTEI